MSVITSSADSSGQALLVVLKDLLLALLSRGDFVISKPLLDPGKILASSLAGYELVGNLEEDVNESLPHGELGVLIDVPLGLTCDLVLDGDNNFVRVTLSLETHDVLRSHLLFVIKNEVLSLDLDVVDEFISSWWITNALKELDTFLTLKILQLAIIKEE